MHAPKILIVDDDKDYADSTSLMIRMSGGDKYVPRVCYSFDSALALLDEFNPDIALVDNKLGNRSGAELITLFQQTHPDLLCIVITAFAEVAQLMQFIKGNAMDVFLKPVDPNKLMLGLNRWSEQARVL